MRVVASPQPAARVRPWGASPHGPSSVRLLLLFVLSAFLAFSCVVDPARAEPVLELRLGGVLGIVGTPLDVTLTTDLDGPWPEAVAVVEVRGPGRPSAGGTDWPVVARVEEALGEPSGRVEAVLALPPEGLEVPGAYLVQGEIRAADGRVIRAVAWMGRVAADAPTLDLAVVWPVVSGVHRDTAGVFLDDVVQKAVVPRADAEGSLYGLFSVIDRFSSWRMTMAVEPLFLAQLRDVADGYSEADGAGGVREVGPDEQSAEFGAQAITTFRHVASLTNVQVIPGPYAMPALPVLASEGWDDGWEQMQLGKAELQTTLQIAEIPDAAYPPDLDMTTDSLRAFSAASIDYVVVRAEVARDLAEPIGGARHPVRAQDRENNRLTLVFVDEELRQAMAPPWDPGRFAAVLASVAADTSSSGPLVAAPADEYALAPTAYVEALGRLLTETPWIRTRTLEDVVKGAPPETRPIFLSRYGGYVDGLVASSFMEGLREAHAAVEALDTATDSDRAPLEHLRRLLFQAESRYWFAAGVDPAVANLGLAYVESIKAAVADEFDKVDVAGDKSVIVVGRDGEVPIAVVNQAGYPIDVRIILSGEGAEFPDGDVLDVTLGVQENIFSVPVTVSADSVELKVDVSAGGSVVDSETIRVRSIAILPVVAWVVAIVSIVVLIGWAALRLR